MIFVYNINWSQWLPYVLLHTGLKLKNSTFCPHIVFMCFVWNSETHNDDFHI